MSNTSTTKTAGNNAGAAEEIAVNKTVNGKPAKCKIESADKERRERQFRRMAADGYTVEKAAEATQTEKEAIPHTGDSGNTEQKPEVVKETYNELLGLDYEEMAANYKIRNWISFVDIEEPIYSGVEMEKVIMDSEHTLRLSVCVDLLREIMNKGCGGPVEFGTICRIIGEYMESSYEVAMGYKKAKAGQEA